MSKIIKDLKISVINTDQLQSLYLNLQCVLCLNIMVNPMQCTICNSSLCEICVRILNQAEQNCFLNCRGYYKKASKFLREYLSNINLSCLNCNLKMNYSVYYSESHILTCLHDLYTREKLLKLLKSKEECILELECEIKSMKSKVKHYNRIYLNNLINMPMDQLRRNLLSFNLSIEKKMEIYHACTEGSLIEFSNLINIKKYPLLEEISYKNYFWTSLHYSMHYGQKEIIFFIMDLLIEDNILQPALRLQANDGRCPLLCLMKSNHLQSSNKEELFESVLTKYKLEISKEVKDEAMNRGYKKTLKKFGKC
jgi:hypothetical protein